MPRINEKNCDGMDPSIRDVLQQSGLGYVDEFEVGPHGNQIWGDRLHLVTTIVAAGTATQVSGSASTAVWDTDPNMVIVSPSDYDFVVVYDAVSVNVGNPTTPSDLTPAMASSLMLGSQWIHQKKGQTLGKFLLGPDGIQFGAPSIAADGGIAATAAAVLPVYGQQVPTPGWFHLPAPRIWDNLNDTVQFKPPAITNLPTLDAIIHVHGWQIARPAYERVLELIDTPDARAKAIRRKLGWQLLDVLRANHQQSGVPQRLALPR